MKTVSITEASKNLMSTLRDSGYEPIVVMNHKLAVGVLVSPHHFLRGLECDVSFEERVDAAIELTDMAMEALAGSTPTG